MPKPANARPLHPPATEAERDRASLIFTEAADDMVARGYARHIWGNLSGPAQDLIILMIRRADASVPSVSALCALRG